MFIQFSMQQGGSGLDPLSLSPYWFVSAYDSDTLYEDSAGTTPAADGQSAGLITDQSGNSLDASQSTSAAKPTRNGRLLTFDGTDDVLPVPNSADKFNFLHDGTGGEIHVAVTAGDLSSPLAFVGNNGVASSKVGFFIRTNTDGAIQANVVRGVTGEQNFAVSDGGVISAGEKFVVSLIVDSDGLKLRKNGVQVATGAVTYPYSSAAATHDIDIGAGGNGVTKHNGAVSTVAAFKHSVRTLSEIERQRLVTELLRRVRA